MYGIFDFICIENVIAWKTFKTNRFSLKYIFFVSVADGDTGELY